MPEDSSVRGSSDTETFAVISGGGTAGHVNPAIAIANALVAAGHRSESLHFVGSERGVDATLVPAAGYELTVLPGRGIERSLTLRNLGAAIGLVRAVMAAAGLLRRLRPAVVVAMGGYASVPCALWARLLRIPIVVAEQNAAPGLANRLVARFAAVSAVSFPDTPLPKAEFTGNPTDVARLEAQPAAARTKRNLKPGQRLVGIFGGSLGARHVNEATFDAVKDLLENPHVVIDHVVGRRDWIDFAERIDTYGRYERYRPLEYEDDMASLYAAAELVVCRAGASTVAELTLTSTASVLIPLPGAPADHQTANARSLVEAGAAELIVDGDLDGETLARTVDRLLGESATLERMRAGAATLARPDAASAVAALCMEHGSR